MKKQRIPKVEGRKIIVFPEARRGGSGWSGEGDGEQSEEALFENLQHDENFVVVRARIQRFSEETSSHIEVMRRALANQNSMQLISTAHHMTESCGRVGAVQMMRQCIALQMLGKRGLFGKADEILGELEGEFQRFCSELATA